MENASKALIIAGGILLTILTLSLVVFMTSATGRMADAQDTKTATEQLVAFNKTYEAYNKKLMYGTDLITVYNKAQDNNKKYSDNENYQINITIKDKDGNIIGISYESEFKMYLFKCTKMDYNSSTGRINEIIFQQKNEE